MKVRVKAPEYKSILKPYTPLHTPPVFRKEIEGLEFTLTQPSPFRVERVPGANSIEGVGIYKGRWPHSSGAVIVIGWFRSSMVSRRCDSGTSVATTWPVMRAWRRAPVSRSVMTSSETS